MTALDTLRSAFGARDPAHARLVAALAVTGGVLLSALFGQFVIRVFHAETGLLAMSIFLSMQAGSMVKDATARARALTTALLIPALISTIAAVASVTSHRPALIGGFVLIAGAAIWVRRFGARAAAIGSLSFMGYFFTLFMRPTPAELPAFALVAAGAVAAQLLVRTALLIKRPRRELLVLLRELRAASSAAVHASGSRRPGPRLQKSAHLLPGALTRLDDVGRAIAAWQRQFQTERHVAIDEQTLAEQVLDARVDIDEACDERVRRRDRVPPAPGDADARRCRARAEGALSAALDERATPYRVHAARDVAVDLLDGAAGTPVDFEAYLLARSTISHARLRDVDLAHGLHDRYTRSRTPATPLSDAPAAVEAGHAVGPHAAPPPPSATEKGWHWVWWRAWAPTTRMSVQVMIAAAIAAGVGEGISASRWYWAVMTAFVIFIGATTRSSILTRAYRRVAGTAIGIVVGVGVVALAGTNTDALVGICIVAVFGMLYLGPVNYLYSAACITTMLVALYRMLGVLDGSILEVRLVETISGAAIGVLCAYLIVSTNSRGVLLDKVDSYFDALDRLLTRVSATPRASRPDVMTSLQRLESAQSELEQTVAAMSAALIVGGSHGHADAIQLMFAATRGAARLTQAQIGRQPASASAEVVDRVVAHVLRTSSAARSVLHGDNSSSTRAVTPQEPDLVPNPSRPLIVDSLRDLPSVDAAARDSVLALARIDWALGEMVNGTRARRRRARDPRPAGAGPPPTTG